MALVERYVDTDVAVTGDGSAGAPWRHLSEAFPTDALPAGLTGGGVDEYVVYFLGSATSNEGVNITTLFDGMIVTIVGEIDGTLNGSIARLTGVTTGTGARAGIHITGTPTLTLRKVYLKPTSSTSNRSAVKPQFPSGGTLFLDACVVDCRGLTGGTGVRAIEQSLEAKVRVRNTLFVMPASADCAWSVGANGSSPPAAVGNNNTFIGNGCPVAVKRSFGDVLLNNNRFDGFGADATGTNISGAGNASTNATSVGTAPLVSQTFSYVDAAAGDYHITVADPANASGIDLKSAPYYPVLQDVDGYDLSAASIWPSGYDYYSGPVVGDRIEIQAQPAASYDYGSLTNIIARVAAGAGGPTDSTVAGLDLVVRAITAPTGWDVTTPLAQGLTNNGVASFDFVIPMEGVWTFGVYDDSDTYTDSPPSTSTTVALASGGGTIPLPIGDESMRDLYYSADGSGDRLDLEFYAWNATGTPATGINGVTPALRINGGAASTTHATAAATELEGGRYRVTVKRASVAAGADVRVASFGGADYVFGGAARVVAVDVATAPQAISVNAFDEVIPATAETRAIVEGSTIPVAVDTAAVAAAVVADPAITQLGTDAASAASDAAANGTALANLNALTTALGATVDGVDTDVSTLLTRLPSALNIASGVVQAALVGTQATALTTAASGAVDLTPVNASLAALGTQVADVMLQLSPEVEWERAPNSAIGYYYQLDPASGVRTGFRRQVDYASATSSVAVRLGPLVAYA